MIRYLVVLLALAMPASAQTLDETFESMARDLGRMQDAVACAPLDHVLKEISKAVPITKTVKLDPEQTANVVIWWNLQPPESNDDYNMAVVIAHPNGRLGLLVGNDGNICASLGLKPDMMESFFEAIAGRPPKAGSI